MTVHSHEPAAQRSDMEAERVETKPWRLSHFINQTLGRLSVKTEQNQKRAVSFIALESKLAMTQPLCDDESGTSGDGRSHTGKGANTDFH